MAAGFDDFLSAMPPAMVERMGRMSALARRGILALVDAEPQTLSAVVDRIGTWDDDPGRGGYPMPRFQFPAKQALTVANDFFRLADEHAIPISNDAAASGAVELLEQLAPQEHRDTAVAVLAVMKGHTDAVELDAATSESEAGFLAYAATAAWLGTRPQLFPSRETLRLLLIKHIRQNESRALGVPTREQINEISDRAARDFLLRLYGGDYPLPTHPEERALWEVDIVAVAKQHLLETPADATTADQARALHDRVDTILRAAAGTVRRPPPPNRTGSPRTQPKRKKPKGRR
jgi:hypothetical protein